MCKTESNRKFCVYRHTSPSGKYYIGITCQKVENRWGKNGIKYYNKNKRGQYVHSLFIRAIKKYGWNNLKHEVLYDGLGEKQAKLIEISLIRESKRLNLSYNITAGGDGLIGVSHESWLKNKKMPEWIKEKLRGKVRTEECKRALSLINKGRRSNYPSRKVNIYTADGQYLDTFDRCTDVDRYLNIRIGKTNAVCTHIQKTVGGLQARYVDDSTPLLNIDYYTKTETISVKIIDTINNKEYVFKTIQAASRYTKIPLNKLLLVAHKRVHATSNGVICEFLDDYRTVKAFNVRNKNSNEQS